MKPVNRKIRQNGMDLYINQLANATSPNFNRGVTDPHYNENLISYFPLNTHLDTAVSQEHLEMLNNFIKKLNYQKYHISVKPKTQGIFRKFIEFRMGNGFENEAN
jgi:hypothetical protein